mgnify:CR=1 FL=1
MKARNKQGLIRRKYSKLPLLTKRMRQQYLSRVQKA